jgi:hypothetical protein
VIYSTIALGDHEHRSAGYIAAAITGAKHIVEISP